MFVFNKIYIPLWLDLLFGDGKNWEWYFAYLHSTMVRFIINFGRVDIFDTNAFTFHYG